MLQSNNENSSEVKVSFEDDIRQSSDLLFFAYRDFAAKPAAILEQYKLGPAHQRALHFIGNDPCKTVSDLLTTLRITKQSLSRVVGDLLQLDLIVEHCNPHDRRQRLLELTAKGREINQQISQIQQQHLDRAYKKAGAQAFNGFRETLLGMIDDQRDRQRFTPQ
jgi:DNA-binding MarR family transcriptional regulator